MKTRTSKAVGAVAGIAAIALSVPLAVNAYADPPAQPTEIENPYPDLQGPGCDAFKAAVPNYKALANVPVGQVLAGIPDVSTFNAAISGGFNPAVNIVPVLENGPYVVFAPTDEAFAALAARAARRPQGRPDGAVRLRLLPRVPRPARRRRRARPAAHPAGRGDQGRRQGRRHQGQRHRQGALRRDPGQQRADLPDRHGAGPGCRTGGGHAVGDVVHHSDDDHHDHAGHRARHRLPRPSRPRLAGRSATRRSARGRGRGR